MLNIKESLLEKYHNQVLDCLITNNIPFDAEYCPESDPKFNSCIFYTVTIKNKYRHGLIVANNGKFMGCVNKEERIIRDLEEGFTKEQALENGNLIQSENLVEFISQLAIPIIGELKFSKAELEEFRKSLKARGIK